MLILVSRCTRRGEVLGAFARRCYATRKKIPDATLPPRSLWRQHFPSGLKAFQHRVSIANPDTAEKVAQAFVPEGSEDKTVIEIFPGPGQLTRALLALPRSRIKKLIVMESAEMYLKFLKPLEAVDNRITVLPIGGESWGSYQRLEELRLLDHIDTVPWDQGVHPQLQFISHLTSNIPGEQLISQLIRSIPDQQWLFKYGRVPMSFLLSEYIWKRIVGATVAVRCKLSIMAAATTSFSKAVPYSELQPYIDHFHPIPSAVSLAEREKEKELARPLMTGKAGNPFVAVNFMPLERQLIGPGLLDKWDYCLRHLYVNRAKPLKNALVYLAPNAQSLVKVLDAPGLEAHQRVDPKTPVRQMSMNDWALLVKAFDEWPFAPEDLSITDAIGFHEEKKG